MTFDESLRIVANNRTYQYKLYGVVAYIGGDGDWVKINDETI